MTGYKDPPKEHQFKKGQIANPKGRPKGSVNFETDLKAELRKTIPVTIRGRRVNVRQQRALIAATIGRALGGNAAQLNVTDRWIARMERNEPPAPPIEDLSPSEQKMLDEFIDSEIQRRSAIAESSDDEPA